MPERKGTGPMRFILALALAGTAGAWDDYAPRPAGENHRLGPEAETLDTAETGRARVEIPDFPDTVGEHPVPRLLDRRDLDEKVDGFDLVPGRARAVLHRLDTDSGTLWSASAPVRAGSDDARFLRLLPGGQVRLDTLPLARIRAIHAPRSADLDGYFWTALATGLTLPVYFGVFGFPYALAAALGAESGSFGNRPSWPGRPSAEFLDHPRPWTATFGATQGIIPRTAMNGFDLRAEPVWTAHLQIDAGRKYSPIAYGLGFRLLSMASPLARDALDDSDYAREASLRDDSVYSARPWSASLEASVALVWAEAPAYTLRARIGTYFSLLDYSQDRFDAEKRSPEVGPLLGMDFDLRPVPHWGLRMEGSLRIPMHEGNSFVLVPALGAGLAYRLDDRPAPARAPGMTAGLTLLSAEGRLVPGLEAEQDMDPWQSTGLAVDYSRETVSRLDYYSETNRSGASIRKEYASFAFTYGLHTDRTRLFRVGLRLVAGMGTRRQKVRDTYTYLNPGSAPETHTSARRESQDEFAFGISPEIGVRIWKGWGAQARILLLNPDPLGEKPGLPVSIGLTYTLPPAGGGR